MGVYIGTSGWSYDHWKNVLYPPGLPSSDRLFHYLHHGYNTVEVNSTFYRWPRATTFANWRKRLPDGFQMAVKAPRGLTHGKRLYEPEEWIHRIHDGMAALGDRAGPLLVQLPPQMERDLPRLAYFLEQMPDFIRVTVELRHSSWDRDEAVWRLLEKHGAAYCVMSGAHLPCHLVATASFVYVRLHGPTRDHLYAGSYSDDDLRWWAERLREWQKNNGVRDVYPYFNNDGGGNAVRNADALRWFSRY
jgi:uncharacterized protein YecE (DUF72 family)